MGPRSAATKSSAFGPHTLRPGAPPRGTSVVLGSLPASTSPPVSDLIQCQTQWRRRGCRGGEDTQSPGWPVLGLGLVGQGRNWKASKQPPGLAGRRPMPL